MVMVVLSSLEECLTLGKVYSVVGKCTAYRQRETCQLHYLSMGVPISPRFLREEMVQEPPSQFHRQHLKPNVVVRQRLTIPTLTKQ